MPRLTLRVTIDGGDSPDSNERLGDLYKFIETKAKRSGLDFLQKIIPD